MCKPVIPFDPESSKLASIYDELPLWSAPFGILLLNRIRYRQAMTVLDVGCGTGFPMLELAQRLGDSCKIVGIDPWPAGIERARTKASAMGITNVEFVEGKAEQLPFTDRFFDLIVSNNGINNVEDEVRALAECFRISKAGGQFVLTVNLPETMEEFYNVYRTLLRKAGRDDLLERLTQHIFMKRKPLTTTLQRLSHAGFVIEDVKEDLFTMQFLDGTSLFNHYFMRLAFVQPWQDIVKHDAPSVYERLQHNLNQLALQNGGLKLTIPFACISCRRAA
ncbi:MAG: methyltransferase domain-containing protein [Bacteroidetes bacterium]|nr:methyltransferase domain-containing protein [Bacteroidota bacterium]MCW5894036.1 methyltransferase domain-containing protein [Bacteroidota bacterium]